MITSPRLILNVFPQLGCAHVSCLPANSLVISAAGVAVAATSSSNKARPLQNGHLVETPMIFCVDTDSISECTRQCDLGNALRSSVGYSQP
jgi:hypothetical protein